MKKILLLLILLLVGCTSSTYTTISQVEAKKMMKEEKNYVILDVRTKEEYAEGYIDGAINIPLNEIENTNKFSEYSNIVVRKDHREELEDNNVKLNEFNKKTKSTDFDNWLSIKNCPVIDKTNSDIIRRVRNSLLHGNYIIVFEDDYFA